MTGLGAELSGAELIWYNRQLNGRAFPQGEGPTSASDG